jgi:metallo-beta-lactamase family protein
MKLSSFGAAEGVTGSKHLLDCVGATLLIDCGLFQGEKQGRLKNWQKPPIDVKSIDAVVLTHAHLDHSGYLPAIVKAGFRGPIYCTPACRDVAAIILKDSARLQEEDAERANREGYSKHTPALALYTQKDVEQTLAMVHTVEHQQSIQVNGIRLQFYPAGHILGACGVRIDDGQTSAWFSGDLGRFDDPLMYPPQPPLDADVVVMEATYGDRNHDPEPASEVLRHALEQVRREGGRLLLPAFAVGRAQLVLWLLEQLMLNEPGLRLPVYLDSPMAAAVSELYKRYPQEHRLSLADVDALFERVHVVEFAERSRRLSRRTDPLVIVAGAGMLSGGRILNHLEFFASDPKTRILLTGFQAPGTRGRDLADGERRLKLHGRWLNIAAQVDSLPGLSAHADQNELTQWLEAATRKPEKVWLVHGEAEAKDALQAHLAERGYNVAQVPVGENVELL